jgi:polyhydroxyalkanoate synthesis regulator phasin
MKKTRRVRNLASAESIARMADQGKDVSRFFTNRGRMMPPAAKRLDDDLRRRMMFRNSREEFAANTAGRQLP